MHTNTEIGAFSQKKSKVNCVESAESGGWIAKNYGNDGV